MIYRLLFAVALLVCGSQIIRAVGEEPQEEQSVKWRYLAIESDNDSLPRFVELAPGNTIKFVDGNVVIGCPENSLSVKEGQPLRFTHRQRSSFKLSLIPPHESYSLDRFPLTLIHNETSIKTDTVTDCNGTLFMDELKPGNYTVTVSAPGRGLIAADTILLHQLDDSDEIRLDEFPVTPYALTVDSVSFKSQNACFDVYVSWNFGKLGFPLPYKYVLSLDNDSMREAGDTRFIYGNLEAGDHCLKLKGITPLGLETDSTVLNFTLDYPASDFIVRVVSDNDNSIPVENIKVALSGIALKQYAGLIQTTDKDGFAHFYDIPSGCYDILVADKAFPFESKSSADVKHNFNDVFEIRLNEKVLSPEDFSYSVSVNPKDLFDVWIEWKNPVCESFSHPDYIYIFTSGDEYIGETSELNFFIEDLKEEVYEYTVYSLSPYGNMSEGVALTIDLNGAKIGNLSLSESSPWIYYDINGRIISGDNLTPGIYIRSNGIRSEKVKIAQ